MPVPTPEPLTRLVVAMCVLALAACDPGTGLEESEGRIVLQPEVVDLAFQREGEVTISNAGGRAVGPVTLEASDIIGPGGGAVLGSQVTLDPDDIPTLNPGASVSVMLRIDLPGALTPGGYSTRLRAMSDVGLSSVPVTFSVQGTTEDQVAGLEFVDPPSELVQGTVTRFPLRATDVSGNPLEAAPVTWSTWPQGSGYGEGEHFVAYGTGSLQVTVSAGSVSDTRTVQVAPRGIQGSMTHLGSTPAPGRQSSDLWVHGNSAYTGTWAPFGSGVQPGNALFAWNITDPDDPVLTDSVVVDARVVNDVKVSEDGTLGVLTHESSADLANGITLLDLEDPDHPRVIERYTDDLAPGVHNVWIDGDHLYVVVDGAGGLRILDVSDPGAPEELARYYGGEGYPGQVFLHDVYVRDGLAFLAHWDAGLVILDVGNGIAGGTVESPAVVSRILTGGETHNAWYWPVAGYVFVGEEDWATPGRMRVVDVADPSKPRIVASYQVSGDTPHNFWLDEEEEILYLAWYTNGIRALDVSGRLLGSLDRQGREVAALSYGELTLPCSGPSGPNCTWAPQLHDGYLYASDMRRGLVVATPAN